jgi:sarcosine oxidase subunit alpha
MVIRAGNADPGADNDRHGFIDRLAPFIPAGFYYKTFMWPDWHLFEPRIRAMAGLGRLDPNHEPPADSPQINERCDVLVIGAGPAGLTAARAASRAGKRVILVDDQTQPGGSLLYRDVTLEGIHGADWAQSVGAELSGAGRRVLTNSTAYGVYQHNLACVWERRPGQSDALWRIRAGQIILATGAIERPLVFPDNDRPGVMSAEAALAFLKRHGLLVGQKIVLATNNTRTDDVVDVLRKTGAEVRVADRRAGAEITGVEGETGVTAVWINGERVIADCLLVSGGFSPTVHLCAQATGKLR